jgi:hypothetical protein
MNSHLIQKELMVWAMASTYDIVVPNYYLGRYECDVLKISKAGHIYEYEVKVSKADFKKDAEKCIKGYLSRQVISTKHDDILKGKRCSRFYFVVPEGLIVPEEVPAGLGLIYACSTPREGRLNFKIVKVSKNFNKQPIGVDFYKHIARNLSIKLSNAKRRIEHSKAVKNIRA